MGTYIENICINAKESSVVLGKLSTNEKNEILNTVADNLIFNMDSIMAENEKDVKIARENNMKESLVERLTLNNKSITAMAEGLRVVARLEDPVGEFDETKTLSNGLIVGKKRVPMGVIAIIYESRPNVTADSFGLCLKAGSATILRGGKEAINSNIEIIRIIRETLKTLGHNEDFVQLIENPDRNLSYELMKQNKYIDVLIPRGSASLIEATIRESSIPVIETGIGNCHVFVDESAKFDMALDIILNSKVQRPGACNACETVLIHENIKEKFIPLLNEKLNLNNVEVRGCEETCKLVKCKKATSEDFAEEFLDLIIAIKVVKNIDDAIEHIYKYATKHSESIVTENYTNAQRFLNEVDAACVYVNASTRFTDGGALGMGAEIGISTQKLHARGPMGLKELTTTKFIIYGDGHIRC